MPKLRPAMFGEPPERRAAVGAPDGRRRSPQRFEVPAAYVIEDEMARVTERLSLARRARFDRPRSSGTAAPIEGAPPQWISNRVGGDVRTAEDGVPRRRNARDGATAEDRTVAAAAPDLEGAAPPPRREPAASAAMASEPREAPDRGTADAQAPTDGSAAVATEGRGELTNPAAARAAPAAARAAPAAARAALAAEREAPAEKPVEKPTPAGKIEPRPDPVLREELARIDPPPLPSRRHSLAQELPARPRRPLRRRMMAVAAVAAIMTLGAPFYWQLALNRIPVSWSAAPASTLSSASMLSNASTPGSASAPGGATPMRKIADRVTPNGPQAANDDHGTTSGGMSEPAPARAVLYEEDPLDPHGKRSVGTVTWHSAPGTGSGPASAVTIKCDIEIEKQMSITLSLRRNVDEELPASHIMEVKFNLPDDEIRNGVSTLKGIKMKSAESARGAALSGQIAKVTPKFFMVALSAAETDMKRNIQLLKDLSWFDIPIVYSSGNRAILAIEKGASGDRAFKDAFAAWGQ
jgi:hypothetical protein